MSLESDQILARVRPQRIGFLVSEKINIKKLMSIISFLSKIWGGRYSPIAVVSEQDDGVAAKRILSAMRPEFIFGVDIDGKKWSELCNQLCQPRGFRILDLDETRLKEYMKDNFDSMIWTEHIILAEIRESPEVQRRNLKLLKLPDNYPMDVLAGFSFGIVPDNKVKEYSEYLKSEIIENIENFDIFLYFKICIEMAKIWSWLDFASFRLDRHQIFTQATIHAPAIIVVNNDTPVLDLAFYWNLRMQFGPGSSGNIVLFPESEIENTQSIEALTYWIRNSPIRSNYCEVLTKRCNSSSLVRLARRLRPRIRKSASTVNYHP